MKIVFISTFFGANYGGAEISIELLFNRLKKRIKNLRMISGRKNSKKDVLVINFLTFLPKKFFILGNSLLDYLFAFLILRKLKKNDLKPGVIHAQDIFSLPASVLVSKKIGSKTVVTVRDNLPREFFIGSLNIFYFRNKKYKKALLQCDSVVAISQHIKRELISFGVSENKIKVIYNLLPKIELGEKKINRSSLVRLIAYGRLFKEKGFSVLIEALNLVKKKTKEFDLKIFGDGPELKNLKKQIEKNKLEKNIEIKKFIPNKKIIEEINSSDLVVFPSIYEEPLGRVAIEAGFCGKPVIASKTGGICEIVENERTGILIKPGNIQELSEAILKLILKKELREEYGKNAEEYINRKFDEDLLLEKYENFYNNLFLRK